MSWSIYLHVPFCLQRCPYCTFYSGEPLERREDYVTQVLEEAKLRRAHFPAEPATTLYLGGGTPSLLGDERITTLISGIRSIVGLAVDAEITVEVNPAASLDFSRLRAAGVTRLSVGVQSLYEEHLQRLGRPHTADQALQTVQVAMDAGLAVSADLMYGYDGLTATQLARDVRRLTKLGIVHLSVYSLEIPQPCAARARFDNAGLRAAEESCEQQQWEALVEATGEGGLELYEVSNFARPGHPSRHNRAYWLGDSYMGLGPGASGFEADGGPFGTRYTNAPDMQTHAEAAANRQLPPGERDLLTWHDALLERLFLQLRMADPFDPASWADRFDLDETLLRNVLAQLVHQGDLAPAGDTTLRPTSQGMRRADGLSVWLMDRLTK